MHQYKAVITTVQLVRACPLQVRPNLAIRPTSILPNTRAQVSPPVRSRPPSIPFNPPPCKCSSQDPKVIAQVSPRHPQRPHTAHDEHPAGREQAGRGKLDLGERQPRQCRLVCQRGGVEVIAQDAEREDGNGERVAASVRVAERELGQNVVLVLWFGRRGERD